MNTGSFRDLSSTVAMSFRLAGTQSTLKRAANIHSHHLTFIGRAPSDVRQCLYFFGRGISSTREGRRFSGRTNKSSLGGTSTDWPLGRGTDSYTDLADYGLLKPVPNRHANRWPVVGTQRRALGVGAANTGGLRRNSQLGDKLVFCERGLVVADKKVRHFDPAFSARTRGANTSAHRKQDRRQIHMRVPVSEMPTNRGHIANTNVGQHSECASNHRSRSRH